MRLTSELRVQADESDVPVVGAEAVRILGDIQQSRRAIERAVAEMHGEAMQSPDQRYVRRLMTRIGHLRSSLDTASDGVAAGRLRGCRDQLRATVIRLPKRATAPPDPGVSLGVSLNG